MTKNKDRKAQVGEDITFITFINLQHRCFKNLTQKPNILSFGPTMSQNLDCIIFITSPVRVRAYTGKKIISS